MHTQPIGPANSPLPAGAFAALGGAPVPMPSIPGMEAPAATAAEAPPAFLTGVSTFDPEPADVTARREKVARARAILRSAMENVSAAHAAVMPILDELKAEADLAKKAEAFDVAAALKLICAMYAPIRDLKYSGTKKPSA